MDCLYFSLPSGDLPITEPILHLDGSGGGPINNLTFLSSLSNRAPEGRALASASVIGQGHRDLPVLTEEARGNSLPGSGKRHKAGTCSRRTGLNALVPTRPHPLRPKPIMRGCTVMETTGLPSIDSALRSGRETAERILGT